MPQTLMTIEFAVNKELFYIDSFNSGAMLRTEEDYKEFTRFIREQTEKIKSDPALAKRFLYATGMYDENGELKEEFK